MLSAWDEYFGAALDGWTGSPGSCPGNSSLLSPLLQTLGVPPPSLLHGLAVGSTFATEVASCTPGLNWSV